MDPFDAALDLLRRLPPSQTEHYLNKIISLVPDLEEDLVSSVDVGLTTKRCVTSGKDYLCCTYNSGIHYPNSLSACDLLLTDTLQMATGKQPSHTHPPPLNPH